MEDEDTANEPGKWNNLGAVKIFNVIKQLPFGIRTAVIQFYWVSSCACGVDDESHKCCFKTAIFIFTNDWFIYAPEYKCSM